MPFAEPLARQEKMPVADPFESEEQALLETLLTRDIERVNEGNNGVIFRIREENLTPSAREKLVRLGLLDQKEREDSVVKLLKLGEPGVLKNEFLMQQRGAATIRPLAVASKEYANIPKPLFFRQIRVSEACRQTLGSRHGIEVPKEGVEIMAMDRVDGTDLETIMLQAFLEQHPGSPTRKMKESLKDFSFQELDALAARTFGYQFPWEKPQATWSLKQHEEYTAYREKLMAYLETTPFRFDHALLKAVEKTARTMYEEAGIIWGDARLRNVMIKEDQAWVIDFGRASLAQKGETDPKILEENTRVWETTLSTIHRMQSYLTTEEAPPKSSGFSRAEIRELTERQIGTPEMFEQFKKWAREKLENGQALDELGIGRHFKNSPLWIKSALPALYQIQKEQKALSPSVLSTMRMWRALPSIKNRLDLTTRIDRLMQMIQGESLS